VAVKLGVRIGSSGRKLAVEIDRSSGILAARLDGRPVEAEAIWLSARHLSLTLDGKCHDVEVLPAGEVGGEVEVHLGGDAIRVGFADRTAVALGRRAPGEGSGKLRAHMPGKVVAVLVAEGDEIEPGRPVVVLEAMKMENELQSPAGGRVRKVHVRPGQVVEGGAPLVEIG